MSNYVKYDKDHNDVYIIMVLSYGVAGDKFCEVTTQNLSSLEC